MDSKNISSFINSQNIYSSQQQQFFFKKPFGKIDDVTKNNEIDILENDLIQFQDNDMEVHSPPSLKQGNTKFKVQTSKQLNITINQSNFQSSMKCLKKPQNLDVSEFMEEQPLRAIKSQNGTPQSKLTQKNGYFFADRFIQAPSSVKSSIMSPSSKSFSSLKKNSQYVLLLNEQFNLNLQYSLSKQDSSQIELLELCDNKLKQIPDEIFTLRRLLRLKLDNNFIKKISSELYIKLSLELFSIKNNLIQTLEPIFVQILVQLLSKGQIKSGILLWDCCIKYLDISYNKIKILDENIGYLTQLKQLFINSNEFKDLPKSMGNLKNLRQISLDWFKYLNPPLETNQISSNIIQNLLKSIITCPNSLNFMKFVDLFSKQGFKIDKYNIKGRNLLHLAALDQDLGVLDDLIDHAPHLLNQLDYDGQSALSLALTKESLFSSRFLLMRDANVNIVILIVVKIQGQVEQGSLLSFTLDNQLTAFTRMIIERGGFKSLLKTDKYGNNPLHYLASSQVDPDNLREFQNQGSALIQYSMNNLQISNQKNIDGWAPIHFAVLKNKMWLLKEMIKANTKKEQSPSNSQQPCTYQLNLKGGHSELSPLQLAVFNDNPEMVQLLIEESQHDLFASNIKLSRLCQSNQRLFKLLQSYEREQMNTFVKNATNEQQHTNNISKLALQKHNKIKLLSSIEKKPSQQVEEKSTLVLQNKQPILHQEPNLSIESDFLVNRKNSEQTVSKNRLGSILINAPTNLRQQNQLKLDFAREPQTIQQQEQIDFSEYNLMKYVVCFQTFLTKKNLPSDEKSNQCIKSFDFEPMKLNLLGRIQVFPDNLDINLQLKLMQTIEIVLINTFTKNVEFMKDLKCFIIPLQITLTKFIQVIFSDRPMSLSPPKLSSTSSIRYKNNQINIQHQANFINYVGNILIYQARYNELPSLLQLEIEHGSVNNQYELFQCIEFRNQLKKKPSDKVFIKSPNEIFY